MSRDEGLGIRLKDPETGRYQTPVSSSKAQPRDLALRSVSHRHWQGNDALVLRISAFTHASFIGLQERFLACARNDDTRKGYPQKFESRD